MKTVPANTILDEKFGLEGSIQRESFREEAYAWYFGALLKQRRKALKITQEDLARSIGKQRPYISRVENGEDIRISNLLLLANALELKLDLVPLEQCGG